MNINYDKDNIINISNETYINELNNLCEIGTNLINNYLTNISSNISSNISILNNEGVSILHIYNQTIDNFKNGLNQVIVDVLEYDRTIIIKNYILTCVSIFYYGIIKYYNIFLNYIENIINQNINGVSNFINVIISTIYTLFQSYNLSLLNICQVIINSEYLILENSYINELIEIYINGYLQLINYLSEIMRNIDISILDSNTFSAIIKQFSMSFIGIFQGYDNGFNGLFQSYSNILNLEYGSDFKVDRTSLNELNNLQEIDWIASIDIKNILINNIDSYTNLILYNYNKMMIYNLRNYNLYIGDNYILLRFTETISVMFNSIMQSISTIISTFKEIPSLNYDYVYYQFINIYIECFTNINNKITILYDNINITHNKYKEIVLRTTLFLGSCNQSLGLSLLGIGQFLDNVANNFDIINVSQISIIINDYIEEYQLSCDNFSNNISNIEITDLITYTNITEQYALSFSNSQQILVQYYNSLTQ
jgi:hypothetical protein